MSILDAIRTDVGRVFGSVFYDAVLMRTGLMTGPDDDPNPGVPETYTCKALVEEYSDYFTANGLVKANERKVTILTDSIARTDAGHEGETTVPRADDIVTINGESLTLSGDAGAIRSDPARAGYVCRAQL